MGARGGGQCDGMVCNLRLEWRYICISSQPLRAAWHFPDMAVHTVDVQARPSRMERRGDRGRSPLQRWVGILHVCGTAAADGHAQVALMKVFLKHSIVHIHRTEVRMTGGPNGTAWPTCIAPLEISLASQISLLYVWFEYCCNEASVGGAWGQFNFSTESLVYGAAF